MTRGPLAPHWVMIAFEGRQASIRCVRCHEQAGVLLPAPPDELRRRVREFGARHWRCKERKADEPRTA